MTINNIIGLCFLIGLLVFIYLNMKIGYVMYVFAFVGLILMVGKDGALSVLTNMPYRSIASYTFAASALFMLAGMIIAEAKFGEDMFTAADRWLGNIRGGLAMATAICSAVLGFITYSSVANMTMGKIAVPEMKKFNYDDSISGGAVSGGASLSSIVPPSNGFILFSLITETSLSQLYMAALIPAGILAVMMLSFIFIYAKAHPDKAPKSGKKYTMKEKLASLKLVLPILLVVILSLIGIYGGVITPTEAASVTAFILCIMALVSKRMTFKMIGRVVSEQVKLVGMISLLLTGAWCFTRLITLSNLPTALSTWILGLGVSKFVVVALIIFAYVLMGMFSDINACILVTVPIFYPILVDGFGFSPLWFGVIVVSLIELGQITPPLGMNVFSLSGVTGIPSEKIFRGCLPYIISIVIFIVLLVAFPTLTTWLPGTM